MGIVLSQPDNGQINFSHRMFLDVTQINHCLFYFLFHESTRRLKSRRVLSRYMFCDLINLCSHPSFSRRAEPVDKQLKLRIVSKSTTRHHFGGVLL